MLITWHGLGRYDRNARRPMFVLHEQPSLTQVNRTDTIRLLHASPNELQPFDNTEILRLGLFATAFPFIDPQLEFLDQAQADIAPYPHLGHRRPGSFYRWSVACCSRCLCRRLTSSGLNFGRSMVKVILLILPVKVNGVW